MLALVLQFHLLLLDETAEDADFHVPVLCEVKAKLLSKSELQQVVVEALFADFDFQGRVLERPPLELLLAGRLVLYKDTIVEFTPRGDLLDDLLDGAFLRPLVLSGVVALVFGRLRAQFK